MVHSRAYYVVPNMVVFLFLRAWTERGAAMPHSGSATVHIQRDDIHSVPYIVLIVVAMLQIYRINKNHSQFVLYQNNYFKDLNKFYF